jgi:hypothetical protein
VIPLTIHADCEQNPLPTDNLVADGMVTDIGLLRHGTTSGKASVGLIVTLADGRQVLGQTTWALLRTAVRALAATPIVAEEVIDP